MKLVQLATRVDYRIKAAVEKTCKARGLKRNRFIEEALLDKLEELEDLEDIQKIRRESTRPLEELLKELKFENLL